MDFDLIGQLNYLAYCAFFVFLVTFLFERSPTITSRDQLSTLSATVVLLGLTVFFVRSLVTFSGYGSNRTVGLFGGVFVAYATCFLWWHFLFYFLPVIPKSISFMFFKGFDAKNFPEIIDYLYYSVGAVFAASLLLKDRTGEEASISLLNVEVWIFVALLSLKSSKVSMKLYGLGETPGGENVRSIRLSLIPPPQRKGPADKDTSKKGAD